MAYRFQCFSPTEVDQVEDQTDCQQDEIGLADIIGQFKEGGDAPVKQAQDKNGTGLI